MKKGVVLLWTLLAALLLAGCGGVYDKEYISVEDYLPASQESGSDEDKITVRDYFTLKRTIRDMVNRGAQSGTVIFDNAYDGDISADMASACWEVRTKDALCAYCVENISYELNHIITYDEAKIYVSYMQSGVSIDEIIRLPYSTDIESVLRQSMQDSRGNVVILTGKSSLAAEDVENMAANVYKSDPMLSPKEPAASVNMFSGENMQRLYDIHINYGEAARELAAKKEKLAGFDPFDGVGTEEMSELDRATLAFEYLTGNCTLCEEGQKNNIYCAVIEKKSDSEGIALAYVALCKQLGIECRIVYGQYNMENHCWNIIKLGTKYYHVDVSKGISQQRWTCFLCEDEQFWKNYRWDVESYPKCGSRSTILTENE